MSLILVLAGLLLGIPAACAAGISPCGLDYPSDTSVAWTCRTIGPGESLESLFGERWVDVARFNRVDRRHATRGTRIKVPERLESIECYSPMPERYTPADGDSQFVLVLLSEQFLGAYAYGRRVFSAPLTTGSHENPTPSGAFRITAFDRHHHSSLYRIVGTDRPYPMHFGLKFHVDRSRVSYWLHGRDLPGRPASHGCIGLYDEAMQKECYGAPGAPALADARWLFEWVAGPRADLPGLQAINGPPVLILGTLPTLRTVAPGAAVEAPTPRTATTLPPPTVRSGR